ncbi:hypothetical protein J6590_009381 [Homalodisca vitripennis]|nr:hypothetical protein J6590_009381 [Homalodisca vitripennis]
MAAMRALGSLTRKSHGQGLHRRGNKRTEVMDNMEKLYVKTPYAGRFKVIVESITRVTSQNKRTEDMDDMEKLYVKTPI